MAGTDMGQGDMGDRAVVHIARCARHGLHGERTECFVCGGPVEQVPMVDALYRTGWKDRGRELNHLYDAITAALGDRRSQRGDPVEDISEIAAERDRLREGLATVVAYASWQRPDHWKVPAMRDAAARALQVTRPEADDA